MRLIDADRIDVIFRCTAKFKQNQITVTTWSNALNVAADKIDEQPTIDAVEVVRCKDCKYMTEHDFADGNIAYWTCSVWDSGTNYDGYCYYGERKEE